MVCYSQCSFLVLYQACGVSGCASAHSMFLALLVFISLLVTVLGRLSACAPIPVGLPKQEHRCITLRPNMLVDLVYSKCIYGGGIECVCMVFKSYYLRDHLSSSWIGPTV